MQFFYVANIVEHQIEQPDCHDDVMTLYQNTTVELVIIPFVEKGIYRQSEIR